MAEDKMVEAATKFCFNSYVPMGALAHAEMHELMADFATAQVEPYRLALMELFKATESYHEYGGQERRERQDNALAAAKAVLTNGGQDADK